MADNRLDGKVALVTGASSGIGEATAVALAEEGATVVLAARRADRLAELAARLTGKGATALTVPLDVTDEQEVEGADTTDWTRMVGTNLLGSMFMVHSALPHLLERKGSIIQISSTAGRTVRAGTAAYNATKWGIGAFSEALRQEVTERGVRVVLIEPGVVDTELRDHITDQRAGAALAERIKGKRSLQSGDIAAAVVYAITQPEHVAVNEILVRPTDQAW